MKNPSIKNEDAAHVAASVLQCWDNPSAGIGIAKSLRLNKGTATRLIGINFESRDSSPNTDALFDAAIRLPAADLNWARYLRALRYLKKSDKINVLVPTEDAEIEVLVRYQSRLAEMKISTLLPTAAQFAAVRKDRLQKLCDILGCFYPHTSLIRRPKDLFETIKHRERLPVYLKGLRRGAQKISSPNSIFEGLLDEARLGWPMLCQSVISGEELNLAGLSDSSGRLVAAVAIKKVSTNRRGKILSAISIESPQMMNLCRRFCRATRWRGPFELECISNGRDLYLIEVNARMPSWVYFASRLGVNLPEMYVNIARGQKQKSAFKYPAGQYFYRYIGEAVVSDDQAKR